MNEVGTAEHLSIVCDEEVGLWAAIAVDDTTLGPGLGGVRFASYPTQDAASTEAQRLARGMTMKNALAGLPYGGAKSVILARDGIADRASLMRRFGTFVTRLGGSYIPGIDMGTTDTDLQEMARVGAVVSCADSDPSPWTAAGVFSAMRSAITYLTDDDSLAGIRVLIQGVGHVGTELTRLCSEGGAEVLISDLDPARAAAVADAQGAHVIDPQAVMATESDVFAPCAAARVLDGMLARKVTTRLVVGAANDTLANDAVAEILRERGICYVPDFLANAGGVIQIHAERERWPQHDLEAAIERIGERTYAMLAETPAGQAPLATATAHARHVIHTARARSSVAVVN